MSSIKEAYVVDPSQLQSIRWGITYNKEANDCEVELLSSFFDRLYSLGVGNNDDYKVDWSPSRRCTGTKIISHAM